MKQDVPPSADGSEAIDAPQASGVKSAVRVLAILEHFAASPRPATLVQLSKQLDWPKSCCFALLETLRQAGYVYWLGKEHGYYPTRRWRDLGERVSSKDPILAMAAPALAELRDKLNETTILAKRDGLEVLYLDAVESTQILRFSAHAGQRKPMHSAASGRAMLALMDEPSRDSLIAKMELQRYPENTPVEPAQVKKDGQTGAQRGWHIAVGEYRSDTTSIAAGFRFGGDECAFVVGAPIRRIETRHDEIGSLLQMYAQAVTEE